MGGRGGETRGVMMLRSIRPELELPTRLQNFFSSSMISCSDTEDNQMLNVGHHDGVVELSQRSRSVEILDAKVYAIITQLQESKIPPTIRFVMA